MSCVKDGLVLLLMNLFVIFNEFASSLEQVSKEMKDKSKEEKMKLIGFMIFLLIWVIR